MYGGRKTVLVLVPVVILAGLLLALFYREENEEPIQIIVPTSTPHTPQGVKVHVIGAVRSPGLYDLKEGDRVEDAVRAAGGPVPEAALERINLAARLRDGQQLKVPRVGEAPDPGESVQPSPGKEININTASAELLDTLPGIGQVRSKAMVESRLKDGPFKDIKDLVNRKLLPQSVFEEIKDKITAD